MAKYAWRVNGITKHYGKMKRINDTVETSRLDSASAHRKARGKYPKARELSVTRIVTERTTPVEQSE